MLPHPASGHLRAVAEVPVVLKPESLWIEAPAIYAHANVNVNLCLGWLEAILNRPQQGSLCSGSGAFQAEYSCIHSIYPESILKYVEQNKPLYSNDWTPHSA